MELLHCVITLTIFYYEIVRGATENSISVDTQLTKDDQVGVYHVGLGSSATFKCRPAKNNQKVEWFNPEGVSLSRSSGRVLVQEHIVGGLRARVPFSVLTITRAQIEDTGIWQCRSGETVLDVPICVLDRLRFVDTKTYTVDEGRSITLTCEAIGQPEPSINWSRNGELITDDYSSGKYKTMNKYYSQGFESLLTITEVRPEDRGVYTCEGTQSSWDCTETETVNITLNVNYAPVFDVDEKTSPIFASFNTTVTFDCSAQSYPPPIYAWYLEKNDTLTEIKGFDNETGTFSVVADDTTMGQRYKCRANNTYGYAFKGFTLLELLPPENPDKIEVSTYYGKVDIKLIWDGKLLFPIDEILWQYMKRQESRKPTEYNWEKAQLMKSYSYDDTSYEDVSEKMLTGPSSCKRSDHMKHMSTYGLSLIGGLEEGTEYMVRVRVTNELSASSWSKPLVFTTKSRTTENELNASESTTEEYTQENRLVELESENMDIKNYDKFLEIREIEFLQVLIRRQEVPIYIACVMTVILVICLVLAIIIKTITHLFRNMKAGKSNRRIYLLFCFILLFVIILAYLYTTFF